MQSELDAASNTISKLQQDKRRLKAALSETIQKRDSLFNEANHLYRLLNETKAQSLALEENRALLDELREGVLKRDQLINELRVKVKKQEKPSENTSEIARALSGLVSAAHSSQEVYSLLKQHIGCCKSLTEKVHNGQLTTSFLQILSFTQDLIHSLSSPLLTESSRVIESLPVQIGRVSRLNQEMLDTMARSREILSSPFSLRTVDAQGALGAKLGVAEIKLSFDSPTENLLVDSFLVSQITDRPLDPARTVTKIPRINGVNSSRK